MDTLAGGTGNDTLWGANGTNVGDGEADTFVFGQNWGTDFVYGFDDNVDQFDMRGSGVANFNALTVSDSNGNAEIHFGSNLIVVVGASAAAVQNDFVF